MKGEKILNCWCAVTVLAFVVYLGFHRSDLEGLSMPEMRYYGFVAAVKIISSSLILLLVINKVHKKYFSQKPK